MNLKYSALSVALLSAFSMSLNAEPLSFTDGKYHSVTENLDVTLPAATPNNRFGINAENKGT